MGFSISTKYLRTIPDYAAAAAVYDNITPIRGSNNLRPLGKRSAQHMRIEKEGDVYHAVLYRGRCVSYFPDGVIALDSCGYSTVSTASFIHAVSPAGAFNQQRLWVHLPSGHYALPLKIKRDDAGQWQALNPKQFYKKSYNRVTTARLRAHIKPLMDWMKTTFPLLTNENGRIDFGGDKVWGQFKEYLREPCIPEDPTHFFACVKAEIGRDAKSTAADIKAMVLKKLYQQAQYLDLCTEEELYTYTRVPLGECFKQRSL